MHNQNIPSVFNSIYFYKVHRIYFQEVSFLKFLILSYFSKNIVQFYYDFLYHLWRWFVVSGICANDGWKAKGEEMARNNPEVRFMSL